MAGLCTQFVSQVALALALALAGPAPASAASEILWSPNDAPTLSAAQADAIHALVEDARAVAPLLGLSVGVLSRGAVLRGAWGVANDAPGAQAVTPSSSFRIASITKTFTALVALQLAREGTFDLDADVRRYVPSYPEKPWPIRARQLLSHTSGIGHYSTPKDALTRAPHTTAQSLAIFAHRDLASPPGERFLYSSFGYNLLGAALEGASGQSYATLVQERVFAPLRMNDTRLENGARLPHDVQGFRVQGGKLVPSERIDISSRFASGGARSTVDDLLRYARALLSRAIVDDASWRAMTTPAVTTTGMQADYGLGFSVYPVSGRAIVAHAGGQPEASSLLLLAPDDDTAVVLLTNVEGQGPELHRLASSILEVLLDDGTPRRDLYADEATDELVFEGLRRAFSYGLGGALQTAAAARADDVEVARAFAAFEAMLSPSVLHTDPERARAAIADAFHPAHGRVTPIVGAEIARVLEARGVARSALRRGGPLALFTAYLDACEQPGACRQRLPSLAAHVRRLQAAWRGTPPALLTARSEHLEAHLDALRVLVGRPVHPSFRADLERLAKRLQRSGRAAEAPRVLALSASLHPRGAIVSPAAAQ